MTNGLFETDICVCGHDKRCHGVVSQKCYMINQDGSNCNCIQLNRIRE